VSATLGRVLAAALAAFLAARMVSAHDKKTAGPLVLTIGWGDEPAFSGARNTIDLDVADAAGAPVADADASLAVDVSFGGERMTLPLAAVPRQAGKYRASLVPTRAGVYTFHVNGSIRRQTVDVTSTCSEKTFACVTDAAEIQFPSKDPSAGQLADRIARTGPRADEAVGRANGARRLSLAALAVSVAALGVALLRGRRRDTGG
jgi:hypothetical protein